MASLPCILCGKTIEARFGSNAFYCKGKTYALCTGGCDGGGAYDGSYVIAQIERKSEEEKSRSEVPASDRLR